MDIGREPLTKEQFDSLWSQIQIQLHILFMNKECDALLIYTGLYAICTSTITYEDSLYWNIGDFLYHRCEECKSIIIGSEDYIMRYAEVFEIFDKSIIAMNNICSFLNRTTDSRNIDQLGYMLWERVIIDSLPEDFYGSVYNYKISKKYFEILNKDENKNQQIKNEIEFVKKLNLKNINEKIYYNEKNKNFVEFISENNKKKELNFLNNKNSEINFLNNKNSEINFENKNSEINFENENYEKAAGLIRIKILKSLKKIEILPNCPMIYYKERYEKKALNSLKEKYNKIKYNENIIEYSKLVYLTALKERKLYKYYFLPGSNEQAEKILEDCFFKDKNKIINLIKNMLKEQCNFLKEEKILNEKIIVDKKFLETIEKNLLEKPRNYIYFFNEDISICMLIIQQFSVFEKGFILSKIAYSHFIIEIINNNSEIFRNEIENIYELFIKLDVFKNDIKKLKKKIYNYKWNKEKCNYKEKYNNLELNEKFNYNKIEIKDNLFNNFKEIEIKDNLYNDFKEIEINLFKYALQRIKPCFLNRLCKYTSKFVLYDEIDNYNEKIFSKMINFVTDLKEFINMYHGIVRNRLLNEKLNNGIKIKDLFEIQNYYNLKINYQIIIEREKKILNTIMVPKDHKIFKMLNDIIENRPQRYGKNVFLFLNQLYWGIESDNINIILPNELIFQLIQIYGGHYENNIYKINNIIIKLENFISTVKLLINQTYCILNILQYTVVNAIINYHLLDEIREITGIQDYLLKNIIRCLIGENIIIYNELLGYFINNNIKKTKIDISKIQKYNESDSDFSIPIYLEAFFSKFMKRVKKIHYDEAIIEIKNSVIINIESNIIKDIINSLINKGIIEIKNNYLEYIP